MYKALFGLLDMHMDLDLLEIEIKIKAQILSFL